jgi:hypothetical protein
MAKKKFFLICFFLFATTILSPVRALAQGTSAPLSQENLPYQTLALTHLKHFKGVKKKQWQLAGDVFADRKKEKHLETSPGSGILVSQPRQNTRPLETKLQHGDMDLELDFLLAKGSKSGILLQGRYLIYLQDNWRQNSVAKEVSGSILAGDKLILPVINAAKAPGLWQHLRIRFKAPRFDAAGKKIADALIAEVILNGKRVQQNITASAPAAAAPKQKEAPTGPLVFLPGSGPVAYKNISYKTYDNQQLLVQNVQYQLHKGRFRDINKLPTAAPFKTGTTDSISQRLGDEDQLLILEGEMAVPRTGNYLFKIAAGGPAWLFLNGKLIAENKGTRDFQRFFYGTTQLNKGKQAFKLIFSNHDQSLVVHYEGPGIPWTALTTPASLRRVAGQEPLIYTVKKEPVMQRGFMQHGQGTNPYAAAVGIPGGVNYAYDLNSYTPLSVWHGGYLDVGPMWIERGEKQLAHPLGPELQLSGLPTISTLPDQDAAWPDSLQPDSSPYTDKGYKLRPNGLPVFFYTLPNATVEDYFTPAAGQEGLIREITIKPDEVKNPLYLLLASGTHIQQLPNGAYTVNDKSYYIEDIQAGNAKPILRKNKGQTQLLLPISAPANGTQVKYAIIW